MPLFETITDVTAGAEALRRRSHGVIEIADERLVRIQLRPFPKWVWLHDALVGDWYHRCVAGNRCWLYFNQPRQCPNFLALKYVISARGTTFGSFRRALAVLDRIAEVKRTDAILCDAANFRISPRLLARWGWEPHTASRWHRNHIKRFYGKYEGRSTKYEERSTEETSASRQLSLSR